MHGGGGRLGFDSWKWWRRQEGNAGAEEWLGALTLFGELLEGASWNGGWQQEMNLGSGSRLGRESLKGGCRLDHDVRGRSRLGR